jgi:hypothetical protein
MIYYRKATRAYDNALVITKLVLNNSLNVINNVSKLKKRIIDQKIIRIKNQNNVRVKFLKQSYKPLDLFELLKELLPAFANASVHT